MVAAGAGLEDEAELAGAAGGAVGDEPGLELTTAAFAADVAGGGACAGEGFDLAAADLEAAAAEAVLAGATEPLAWALPVLAAAALGARVPAAGGSGGLSTDCTG